MEDHEIYYYKAIFLAIPLQYLADDFRAFFQAYLNFRIWVHEQHVKIRQKLKQRIFLNPHLLRRLHYSNHRRSDIINMIPFHLVMLLYISKWVSRWKFRFVSNIFKDFPIFWNFPHKNLLRSLTLY